MALLRSTVRPRYAPILFRTGRSETCYISCSLKKQSVNNPEQSQWTNWTPVSPVRPASLQTRSSDFNKDVAKLLNEFKFNWLQTEVFRKCNHEELVKHYHQLKPEHLGCLDDPQREALFLQCATNDQLMKYFLEAHFEKLPDLPIAMSALAVLLDKIQKNLVGDKDLSVLERFCNEELASAIDPRTRGFNNSWSERLADLIRAVSNHFKQQQINAVEKRINAVPV